MAILNNVSNLKTSIFHEICHKISNFFLTIRKIMTYPTSVSVCKRKNQSVFILQPFSDFGVCSPQTQTNMVCSFTAFVMLKQWPSTQENVLKFYSQNTEQISYSSQLKVNELYTQSIVIKIKRYSFDC